MCKGSNTTSTTSSANPQAMSAYSNILNQAQNVASTPYQAYSGELTAGINNQQQTGIAGINANANYAQPYIQQAAGMATNAAAPITAGQIQQYESPYTQQVVNSTQAQFNNQNQQQQQGVVGNAISQGAFGGNRVGVAQAELANQQQLAQAPVIAGLENQGYQTGLNTALTEQQAQAAGAYSLGNLGVSGQNAALTGANAQVGAGTLQQQTQQAQDLAQYGQYINQQAYPYQQLSWLSGIDTGVGSQMGGTSSTTGPSPSILGQIMGGTSAGVGALGATGAFGSAGWLAAAGLATGGAVPNGDGVANQDGPQTVPETPETLQAQQQQLVAGDRRAQMFPTGTPELDVPPGMERAETNSGVFHYNPQKISADQIRHAAAQGLENEVLDLGSVSKAEVLQRLQRGETPVAVVERDANGTEVRAALGTNVTAPKQLAEMQGTASQGHTVRLEDPRGVLADRVQRHLGGRVPRRDVGGSVQGVAGAPYGGGQMPYSGGHGWIPGNNITRGSGPPRPPGSSSQPAQPSVADQAKAIGQIAGVLRGQPGQPTSLAAPGVAPAAASPVGTVQPEGIAPEVWSPTGGGGSADALYHRGGRVGRYQSGGVANLPMHNRIMVPRGYADGGAPDDTPIYSASDLSDFGVAPPPYAALADAGSKETPVVDSVAAPVRQTSWGDAADRAYNYWFPAKDASTVAPADVSGANVGARRFDQASDFGVAPPQQNYSLPAPDRGTLSGGDTGAVPVTSGVAKPTWAETIGASDVIPIGTGPAERLTSGVAPMTGTSRGFQSADGIPSPAWPGPQDSDFTRAPPALAPVAEVGRPPGGVATRGIRNNNPGNIEDGPFARSQPGYSGSDGRFAVFETPEAGADASANLLQSYGKKGINTISGIVSRWAPPGDHNDTGAYVAAISRATGIPPDQPVDMSDPAVRSKIASAIGRYENGPGGTAPGVHPGSSPGRAFAGAEDDRLPPNSRPVSSEPGSAGAPVPSGIGNIDWSANGKLWPALMAAGFGMMASRSPFPGVAIGEGGQAGLQTYAAQRGEETQTRLKQAQIDLEAKKLAQSLDMQQKHLDLSTRPYTDLTAKDKAELAIREKAEQATEKYRQGLLDRENVTYIGPTQDGKGSIFLDKRTGTTKVEPIAVGAKAVSGATQGLAQSLMLDREKQREADPSIPPLTLEEATTLAHRAPNADQDTIRRLNLASGAWKAWMANPMNMSNKNAPEASLDYWERRYGVSPAAPAAGSGRPAAVQPAPAAAPPAGAGASPLPPGIPPGSVYGKDRRSGREGYRTPDGRFLVTAGPPPS